MELEEILNLEDKTLVCQDCGQEFTWTAGERKFYLAKGLQDPKRCPECRRLRKLTIDKNKTDGANNGQRNPQ